MTEIVWKELFMWSPPVALAAWILFEKWKSPGREDPTKKIIDRLDDIKNIQIDHGNRLTKVETILEERK